MPSLQRFAPIVSMSFFQAIRMVFRRSDVIARFGNIAFLPIAIAVGAIGVYVEVHCLISTFTGMH